MAKLSDDEIDAAVAKGKSLGKTEPVASSARYDAVKKRLVIGLSNGAEVAIPKDKVEGLEAATGGEIAEVSLTGGGYGLHWEKLDVDLSVPGLIAGVFGTRAFMARHAGRAKSPAKAEASRSNGAKGGRPRKVAAQYVAVAVKRSTRGR